MTTTLEKPTIDDLEKAITDRSLTYLENIVEINPSLLNQNFADEEGLISLATKTYLSSTQRDDKNKSFQILRKILNKKFTKIPHDGDNDLIELFSNKVLLEQLYAEKNTDVDFEIFKIAVLKTLVKSSSDNSFNKIYKQIFESINEVNEVKEDNQKKPIKDANNNSMFIYSSGLKNHQSYFIFHVDAQNKLTSISYCDGSSTEHSKTHIYGVKTFALEDPVEYSSAIARSFIKNNCQEKTIDEFHKKLKDKTIQTTEVKIDYAKTTYSIPTTAQKGENYTSKNTSILARFVAQKTNPQMTFELDSKTKKPKGDGHNEYKKFKENLIKEASKSTLKLQEKTSKKSDNFSKYLKKEIEKTLDEAEKNNKRKLSSAQRLPNPRKIFHRELSEILSKKIQNEPEKTPPIEEFTITQELQKKFPGFFPPEKQSSIFYASRSKSPSISLRENLTVKEKAEFIKTYHDLFENKYKKIQSQKKDVLEKFKFLSNKVYADKEYEMVLQSLDNKMLDLLRESKKLDIEEEKILKSSDSKELDQKLYDLDNYKYPTSKIFGQNAIYSRKKLSDGKSIAMKGEEFFKFSVLKDLMEVERKIKDEEEKNKKTIDSRLDIKVIEKGELVKTIQKIDESEEFKFSAEDLKIFLDLERNKLKDPSIKTSKEDPLLILKRVIEARKESLNTHTPKQDEDLFKNLLDLIEKEQERERERERKTSILKKLLRNFKKFSEAKDDSKTKFEKNYRENLVEFFSACPEEKEHLDVINSFAIKSGTPEKKLEMDFYHICANDASAELKDSKGKFKNFDDKKLSEKLKYYVDKLYKLDPDGLVKVLGCESDDTSVNKNYTPTKKNQKPPQTPTTTTSLSLGFVPQFTKQIKDLVKTPVRFGVRLFEEMQRPDTNIFQAFHEVLLNINNKKTK